MTVLEDAGVFVAAPTDPPGVLMDRVGQIEFAGILLGADTAFHWGNLTGWDSLPGLDDGSSARPDAHGDFPGALWAQSRMVTFDGWVEAERVVFEQVMRVLRARLTVAADESPLIVDDGDGIKVAYGRVVAREIAHSPARKVGREPFSFQWRCSDPLRYALDQHEVSLSPSSFVGGLPWPLVFPLDYGSVTGQSSTVAHNAGDAAAPAVVIFKGPSGPGYVVTNRRTGQRLGFDLTLVTGDTLTVDTRTGTVALNGSTDRASFLSPDSVPPELWRIEVGDNDLAFTVPAGAGVGTGVDLRWADTYW